MQKEHPATLCCSFCGKGQREVKKLIAGPSVYICNECIGLCNDIIAEEVDRATEDLPQVLLVLLEEQERVLRRVRDVSKRARGGLPPAIEHAIDDLSSASQALTSAVTKSLPKVPRAVGLGEEKELKPDHLEKLLSRVARTTGVLRSVQKTPPKSLSDEQLIELNLAVTELMLLAVILEREVGPTGPVAGAPRD